MRQIPSGTLFIFTTVRLAYGELARTFNLDITEPVSLQEAAEVMAVRAAELVDREVPACTNQLMTLTILDREKKGGASWQCLSAAENKTAAFFGAVVGTMAANMLEHAVRHHEWPAPAGRVLN